MYLIFNVVMEVGDKRKLMVQIWYPTSKDAKGNPSCSDVDALEKALLAALTRLFRYVCDVIGV